MNVFFLGKEFPALSPFVFDDDFPLAFPLTQAGRDEGFQHAAVNELFGAARLRGERLAKRKRARPQEPFDSEFDESDFWRWTLHAVHEAGHAIVAFELGWKPDRVRIAHEPHTASRYDSIQSDDLLDRLPQSKHRDYWECVLAMKAGGIAAQKFLLPGKINPRMAEFDFTEAVDISLRLIGPLREKASPLKTLNQLLRQATARAEEIVGRNRKAVSELACESLKNGLVRGERIERILRAHGAAPQKESWE